MQAQTTSVKPCLPMMRHHQAMEFSTSPWGAGQSPKVNSVFKSFPPPCGEGLRVGVKTGMDTRAAHSNLVIIYKIIQLISHPTPTRTLQAQHSTSPQRGGRNFPKAFCCLNSTHPSFPRRQEPYQSIPPVIPANAGIQSGTRSVSPTFWTPVFTGVTR